MGTRMTLLELLNEYYVEIPIIQRDYVQGRQNAGAKAVRQTLLGDMKKAICKITLPLDLNFVYGKKVGKKFIPIDGQQRLTTLFLLHLYAFRNDESKTPLLERFTYETRASSREFLKNLVKNRSEIFSKKSDYPKPSDVITDSSDFVSSYNCDPTVQSALVMLDEIAAVFGDVEGLAQALELEQTEDPPISFNFQEIEKLGSEDSLYIKLNARGKPLTDFENFKAKLLGALRKLSKTQALPFSADEFENKFDTDWTDLFWQRKNTNYEKEFRTFFEILLFNYKLIGGNDENWVQALNYDTIPAEVFICAFNLLNYLCAHADKKTETVASLIVFKALDVSFASFRVAFHFVCVFLLKCNNLASTLAMRDWVRVFRNLVFNTNIDNYSAALDAVKSINDFSSKPQNLNDVLSNIGTLGRGFDKEQLAEEVKKAAVILAERKKNNSIGGQFETAIYDAEKLPFFGGQIRAGLYPAEDKKATFGYDLQKFLDYWASLKQLFGDFGNNSSLEHGILLRQALLSIGDYTLTADKTYKTLCSDHTDVRGSISLKRLFSDCGNITTKLLNQVVGKSNIVDELNKIIDTNLKSIPQTDWRYCLIQYPDLFGCMSSYYYRVRVTSDKVLMVSKLRSSGVNFEIFTDALKREMETRSIYLKYDLEVYQDSGIGKTTEGDYFVVHIGAHGKRYKIRCFRSEFVITDSNKNEVFRSKSKSPITETADYIEHNLK